MGIRELPFNTGEGGSYSENLVADLKNVHETKSNPPRVCKINQPSPLSSYLICSNSVVFHENSLFKGASVAQFVKYEIGNLRVASLSQALGTGRYGPSIHIVEKWVPGILTRMAL